MQTEEIRLHKNFREYPKEFQFAEYSQGYSPIIFILQI
jgi:hypothetical protein